MNDPASWKGKTVLLSSFRNEVPFVLEFVAHHKVLGFDEIVIASNDCTDGTAEVLDALDAMGVIHHVPCNPPPHVAPQVFAYQEMRDRLPVDQADWLMILDADELLNIHTGGGRLSDLLKAQAKGTDLVLVNWACFGADGHDRWEDRLSSQRFVHRLRTLNGNGLVKCLIRRPTRWQFLGNHHPFGAKARDTLRIAFAGGLWSEEVAAASVVFGAYRFVKTRVGSFRFAQVNHYATRTRDSFALRKARGDGSRIAGRENEHHNALYFQRMSSGPFLDDTILRYADAVTDLIARYRENPRLDDAVRAGLRHYQAEIDRYWQETAENKAFAADTPDL